MRLNDELAADRQNEDSRRQEDEALLHAVRMHSIISVTDGVGRIVEVNDNFCRISGYSRAELLGQTHRIVQSNVQDCAFWTDMWRTIAAGRPWRGEVCNRAKDGSLYWVDSAISPFLGADGRLEKCVSMSIDITAAKLAEQRLHDTSSLLRVATGKADQANAAKSLFLANMSHEIRTPLNVVIGLSYLLGHTPLNEEQSAFLGQINIASKLLLAVINDVLDLSKIEAGELLIARAAFSPGRVLQDLVDTMSVQAKDKGITLQVDLSDDLPAVLEGDAARLGQILSNLVANAIKFTERGGVTLGVHRLASSATGVTLRFIVRDTGIGIDAEAQTRLFTPFVQADESITRRYGGTGLGLSIVHNLTKLLGGNVNLASVPGVGSEFRVELNFALAVPEALAVQRADPVVHGARALAGVRVLAVDDNDLNLLVTKRILEQDGAAVELASNGEEACQRLRAEPFGFDIVLMDVQMPVLDGYEATRRIRTDLGLVDLPIIAVTAGALSSERQRAAAAGMDDFIVKPFEASALVASVRRHVRVAGVRAATPIDAAPGEPEPAALWPEIDGIDSIDARTRWCEDSKLFRSMLKRFLDEFAGIAIPDVANDPAAHSLHAARLHKLRGGAGMLGAKAVHQLASETEAAYAAGEIARAERLGASLGVQLLRLRNGATADFAAAAIEPEAAAGGAALEAHTIIDLVVLLRQQRLTARERFATLAPQLQRLLGNAPFALLRQQIDNLQFIEAAQLLEAAAA